MHSLMLYIVPSLEQPLYLGIDFWNKFGITSKISSFSFMDEVCEQSDSTKHHELSAADRARLVRIIDAFPSSSKLGLGRTKLVTHVIDVGAAKPLKQRFYAVSPVKQICMRSWTACWL